MHKPLTLHLDLVFVPLFTAPRVFFFFFSSRRRHTRFDCDWSSDVCSSDLHARQTCCLTVIVKLPRLAPWKSVSSPKKRRSWHKSLNSEVSNPPTWRNKSSAAT